MEGGGRGKHPPSCVLGAGPCKASCTAILGHITLSVHTSSPQAPSLPASHPHNSPGDHWGNISSPTLSPTSPFSGRVLLGARPYTSCPKLPARIGPTNNQPGELRPLRSFPDYPPPGTCYWIRIFPNGITPWMDKMLLTMLLQEKVPRVELQSSLIKWAHWFIQHHWCLQELRIGDTLWQECPLREQQAEYPKTRTQEMGGWKWVAPDLVMGLQSEDDLRHSGSTRDFSGGPVAEISHSQ